MGGEATTTGAAGGAGLIITLMTSSETLATFSSFKPSPLVSNWRVPPAEGLRLLGLMRSSDRPREVISMTSLLVILLPSGWLQVAETRRRNKAARGGVSCFRTLQNKI